MYILQQLNIHSNIRDQMTDGYMYVGQPTYNYTWFPRYVSLPCCMKYIIEKYMAQNNNTLLEKCSLNSSSLEYIHSEHLLLRIS